MNRRNFVASSVAVAGATLMNSALASGNKAKSGKNLHIAVAVSAQKQKKLIADTQDCLNTGRTCLTHCAKQLASGDPMMAKCNLAVQNMLAACEGLNKIAHLNTLDQKSFKAFVAGCLKVCEECHAECKKHADHHAECKACMESCERCIKTCKSIA